MQQINEDTITLEWSTDDVLEQCDWLTKEQARHVLKQCLDKHDCNIGLSWDVIDDIAWTLFPNNS